ncbi:TPA: right-handed parallel beta-helix repeat-containing protein [Vibrio parahaemolyticus]
MVGIFVGSGSKVYAKGAKISNNGGDGVIVEDGSYAELDGADISGNEHAGVRVSGDSVVSAENARIENNGLQKLYAELGLTPEQLTPELLKDLIEQLIEKDRKGWDDKQFMDSIAHGSAFATLASSEPFIGAVSVLLAYSIPKLRALKAMFSS